MNTKTFILTVLAMITLIACGTKSQKQVPENDYKVFVLNDVINEGSAELLISPDPDTLKKYLPDGTFPLYVNAVLVQKNDSNFLFDTGAGMKLVENLAEKGVVPENVHKLFITHCHGDHIGGLLKNEQVVFPNAELFMNKIEHDYWLGEQNPLFLQVIEKYKNQLQLFEIEEMGKILFPDIFARAAYGHTPGHTMYLIGNEQQTLIWGDLTHVMPVQMPHPQYSVTFDVNPVQAAETRQEVLKFVAAEKIPVAGMHIPATVLGKISENGVGGYVFQPFE
ncbi:MAG: MBL fold metallo-hydrolase [Prevotellaceae bacterium]|jgi:glyoxylase-like metal-dependent hydrolase (beta-lactamase superfamily II)|nr:MBL fold metallo-hydrolase [Prevotellaceae bacterium]